MKYSGIIKLRIAVALLFFIVVVSIMLSFMGVDAEEKEFDEWYNSLSDSEIADLEQLSEVYINFPYEGESSRLYEMGGLLLWLLAGGLFILMIKVWSTKEISSQLIEQEQPQAQCSNCGCTYNFNKGSSGPTYVECPECGEKDIAE